MIDPSANPDGWNKLIVAGRVSPGVVKITGATRVIGWDMKSPSGNTGGTSSRTGKPLGKFDSTFFLVDDPYQGSDFADWDEFEAWCRTSVDGEKPIALEVVHPNLQRLGWTAAVVTAFGDMDLDGKGGGAVKLSWGEHNPPAPKPTGSATKTKTGGGGPPETEADRKIREAAEQLQKLKDEGDKLW